MLHITNGDSAAGTIRETGIGGEVLAWRDVLHEGPVPSGLTLEQMSEVRSRFLASLGWGTYKEIRAEMAERDKRLRSASAVVLWFEHDLYDQLQLLQILSALAKKPPATLEMICIDGYLGSLDTRHMTALWPERKPVRRSQLILATAAWSAFCSPHISELQKLVSDDLSALPFLKTALLRHLQEYPSDRNGLSRTERQILEAIAEGNGSFQDVYVATQRKEDDIYMGDSVVRMYVERMAAASTPLLTLDPLTLTAAGRRVLSGSLDHRKLNGVDRWMGGAHVGY
jgi:hypothetical protein